MTRDEALLRAGRLACVTERPVLVFRSPAGVWDVWHTLDAAAWLGEGGEVVLPELLRDPERVEQALRDRAAEMRGVARARLLDAAMAVRGRLAALRRQQATPGARARLPTGMRPAGS